MCAQAKLSTAPTVDLYSALFDLQHVALHPTWLHSVECQSGQVWLCPPAQSFQHISDVPVDFQIWGGRFCILWKGLVDPHFWCRDENPNKLLTPLPLRIDAHILL